MMNYAQQIKHPKWQKKRLEVLKVHKFACQSCGEQEEELHVHHPVYKRGAMIWEYDKNELECLCHRCHKDAHAIDEQIKKALASCKHKEKVLVFIQSLSAQPAVKTAPTLYAAEHYQMYDEMAPTEEEAQAAANAFFARMHRLMDGTATDEDYTGLEDLR